ncbi:heat shock protein DDB_G0288861 [Ochlerotatus camptorhynchus]|uniref:heat shock protein DDB_G0288861 n=1 Tax=Ochlerotatus camptorhynchus TaxID=644619 RepID=UPI0031DF2D5B
MSNRQPPSNDELEVAEAKNPLVDLLYDYTAQALMSRIGNYVYHRFDACLAIVEKTAKWSLPQPPPSEEDTGKTTISAPPLVRPLPWIFFLPALIALRLLRYSLSFVALLIGKQPVCPITMVSFLQNRRRKLRALKYRGLKLQRMQRAEKESKLEAEEQLANTWLRRITLPLRYIICFRAVRPGTTIYQRDHHHHHHHRHHHQRPSEQPGELADEPTTDGSQRAEPRDRSTTKKRNAHERDADDSESSFEEASVQELLEKYASAEADSSFHASDVSSADSDSDIFESDKSHTEAAEDAEKNDPKKIKKESNGHTASQGKEPESKTEKPQETKQKASLNATVDKPEEKPTEPAPENGNVASKKELNEEKPAEATQKPTAAESESKIANQSNPGKEQPPEDASSRNDNQNSSSKQSPASMKEVKTSFHQRNKHQQQHQPNQQQHQPNQQQQQQQQQQHTAANGGGGGGKKHKKPHHHNTQHN